ncbi:HK97-gp10 family putative phage morphogenesis protein [Stenotrophomonas sp.]|uniref:HK97-gp10 family putative phage morphogenesis protein n=1 Tax=Stenotrophomonas sp. TaxID=69392 RepID=UPI0028AAC181|nr:HK97-gp10 family putative phage morphogenesis protein [Stenotrophomonas sp.]
MTEQIQIEGLDGLLSSLRDLPSALQSKTLQSGMRRGGNLIRDDARSRVARASGFLSTQIVVRKASARERGRAGLSKGDAYLVVGVKTAKVARYARTKRNHRRKRAGKLYEKSGWAYYWRFLEFGTRKMAAKPFLTPAAESNGPQAAQVMIDQTWKAIERAIWAKGWR